MHKGTVKEVKIQVASLQKMVASLQNKETKAKITKGPGKGTGGWDLSQVNALQAGHFLAQLQAEVGTQQLDEECAKLGDEVLNMQQFCKAAGINLTPGREYNIEEARQYLVEMESAFTRYEEGLKKVESLSKQYEQGEIYQKELPKTKANFEAIKPLLEVARLAYAAHKVANETRLGPDDFKPDDLEVPREESGTREVNVSQGQGAKQAEVQENFIVDGERNFFGGRPR